MNKIITINREFGSGGRKVGLCLAEELGVPFYDKGAISVLDKDVVQSRYGGFADVQELGLPITQKDNMVLPCGTMGRWSFTKTEI